MNRFLDKEQQAAWVRGFGEKGCSAPFTWESLDFNSRAAGSEPGGQVHGGV